MQLDVFTLFPEWFDWFRTQRHVRNALEHGHEMRTLDPRDAHAAHAAARSTTRRSAAAPGWCCASTSWTRRCARSTASDPVELRDAAARDRADPRRAAARRRASSTSSAEERALTLLCGRYEGFDERIVQHFASDTLLGRAVRALRRRAGGDGRRATRCCASCPARSATRTARWRSRSRRRSRRRPGVPALHAPGGVPRLAGARRAAVGPPRGDRRRGGGRARRSAAAADARRSDRARR